MNPGNWKRVRGFVAAAAGLGAVWMAPLRAQTPTTVLIGKMQRYEQTSASSQRPAGAEFGVVLGLPNPQFAGTVVQLRTPTGGSVNLLRQIDGSFAFTREFESMAALDVVFPDGPYAISVSANTASTTTIQMPGGASVEPVLITNFDALQSWSGPSPVPTWQPVRDAMSTDALSFSVVRDRTEIFSLNVPASATRAEAYNLPVFTPLTGVLDFARVTVTRTNGNATVVAAARGFQMRFPMRCVAGPVEFLIQPVGRILRVGDEFRVFATAAGVAPMTYQWKKNGVPIPGATGSVLVNSPNSTSALVSPSLAISNVQLADAGTYTVDVTTGAGTVNSDPAALAIRPRLEATVEFSFGAAAGLPHLLAFDQAGALYFNEFSTIRKRAPDGTVATVGTLGNIWPSAMAVASDGTLYFASADRHVVLRMSASGVVTTLAGALDQRGFVNGTGAGARFFGPSGVAVDAEGMLYVTDSANSAIRRITPAGVVTTLAGGTSGSVDGPLASARFRGPHGIAADRSGNLFVLDALSRVVRKITPAGIVTTVHAAPTGASLGSMAVGSAGHVFVSSSDWTRMLVRLSPEGGELALGPIYRDSRIVSVLQPAFTVDPTGTLFVVDRDGQNCLKVTVSAGTADPGIGAVTGPQGHVLSAGSGFVLTAEAAGPGVTYQWWKDGSVVPDATAGRLFVPQSAAAHVGEYSVMLSNGLSERRTAPATVSFSATEDTGRMANLAIRSQAGTGAATLIVGFVVGGQVGGAGKPLLLRGVGPGLAALGVSGALVDPTITLMRGPQVIASNDNWDGSSSMAGVFTSVGAFSLPADSRDAASTVTVTPGSYTLMLGGNAGATGIGLAEIYELPGGGGRSAPRVVNLSTRTHVGTGSDVLIAGFAIGGQTSRTVLIRGVGPTLSQFGVGDVLVDPNLKVFAGQTLIASNDDWNDDREINLLAHPLGAFNLNSRKESAVLLTLAPGAYTAQLSGSFGTTGIALVEIYEVP